MKGAGLFPHTSQSGSAFKGRGGADAADKCAEAEVGTEAEEDAAAGAGLADVEVGGVEARRLEGGVVEEEDEGENPSVDGDGLSQLRLSFFRSSSAWWSCVGL